MSGPRAFTLLTLLLACSFQVDAGITASSPPGDPNAVTVVSQISTTIGNVGGGDDDLHAHTIPANTLTVDGSCLEMEFVIHTASNANTKDPANVALIEGVNTTTINNSAAGGNNNASHRVLCSACRTSSTGVRSQCIYSANVSDAAQNFIPNLAPVTGTYTWANAGTLKNTATGVADNDIVTYRSVVLKHPAPQ